MNIKKYSFRQHLIVIKTYNMLSLILLTVLTEFVARKHFWTTPLVKMSVYCHTKTGLTSYDRSHFVRRDQKAPLSVRCYQGPSKFQKKLLLESLQSSYSFGLTYMIQFVKILRMVCYSKLKPAGSFSAQLRNTNST